MILRWLCLGFGVHGRLHCITRYPNTSGVRERRELGLSLALSLRYLVRSCERIAYILMKLISGSRTETLFRTFIVPEVSKVKQLTKLGIPHNRNRHGKSSPRASFPQASSTARPTSEVLEPRSSITDYMYTTYHYCNSNSTIISAILTPTAKQIHTHHHPQPHNGSRQAHRAMGGGALLGDLLIAG